MKMDPNPQLPEELRQAFDPDRIVYLHSGHRTVEEYAEMLSLELIVLLRTGLNIPYGELEPEDFAEVPLIWDLIQQLTYNEVVTKDPDAPL
jgi:hypothetical protein